MIQLHPAKILLVVSRVTDVSLEVLMSQDRHKHIARARFAAYVILREHGFSYPVIGKCLNRDHTTAIAGYKKAIELKDNDFEELLQLIRQAVESMKVQPTMAAPPSLEEFRARCIERCDAIKATDDQGMFAQRYLEDVTILLRLLQGQSEAPETLYQRCV